MRREWVRAAVAAWAGFVLPGAAQAQSGYGGGLIELLVTGSASGQPIGPGRVSLPGAPDAFGRRAVLRTQPAGDPYGLEDGSVRRGLDADYRRQVVTYDGPEAPGTLVVDTPSKHLFHVLGGGRAMRYGIGVGRPGFTWAGTKTVTMKREWPDWTPPAEMRARRPDLPLHMEGGPGNPLGARALYLGSSLYRIHGTNEPHTIGQNVSSGCIRMMNEDVIHLYGQVGVGTRVKVI